VLYSSSLINQSFLTIWRRCVRDAHYDVVHPSYGDSCVSRVAHVARASAHVCGCLLPTHARTHPPQRLSWIWSVRLRTKAC
jgi:hypothetical protein